MESTLQKNSPIGEGDFSNVQVTNMWKRIDENMERYKRDG